MPDGNPLVAQAKSQTTGITGIGIAESAVDLANGVKDGSWVESGLGAVGVGLEALSLVVDPIGTLAQYGVSWLIEHVQPLKEALDWLAGDPPVIQSFSDTWANVSTEVAAVAQDYLNEAKNGTAGWDGAAAEAYRATVAEQSDALAGAASLADGVSTGVMIMGTVVSAVRELVRDLVAELVGKLISWALEEACTLGFATPLVAVQATTAITKAISKVSEFIRKLVKTIGNVAPKLRKIIDKLGEIMEKLAKLGRKAGGKGGTTPSAAKAGPKADGPNLHEPKGGDTPSSPDGVDGVDGPGSSPSGKPKSGDGKSPSMKDNADNPKTDARDTECTPGSGEPIDLATGQMYLEQYDIELVGTLPLDFERTHYSSYRVGRFFGPSWSSTLDQRIEIEDDAVYFADSDGARLVYPLPPDGDAAVFAEFGARWALRRTADGYAIDQPERGRTLTFTGHAGLVPIAAITDRHGNQIAFDYDENGAPTGIRHSGGYRIGVETADLLVRRMWLEGDEPITLMRYSYDEQRRLTEVVNSSGRAHRFRYDASGRIIRWEDRNGEWYAYHYDHKGRCVRTEGSGGAMAGSWSYDEENAVTVYTDSRGHAFTHHFNELWQVVREIGPLGEETLQEWDDYDRLVSRTDPLGRRTTWERDDAGNVVRITRPDRTQAMAEYNELGLPVVIVDPDGAVWRQSYDETGFLVSSTDPLGATTTYQRNERGQTIAITDPTGGTRRVERNAAGLAVAVIDALGATTRYARDQFGRVSEIALPTGGVERFTWTVEGKMTSHTHPDGTVERWRYDGEGSPVEHVDVLGNVSRIETTHFDFPSSEVRPDGSRLAFEYDTEMNLVAVTNTQGEVWRYDYDPVGRLVAETDFAGRATRYERDLAGQVTATVNGAGERVEYVRNTLGEIIERRSADGTIATYEFDQRGRLVAAANAHAAVTFERDVLGRIVAETVNGRTVRTEYDLAGRRVSRTTPTGAAERWTFDAGRQPVSLRTSGRTMSFGHDAAEREVERLLDSGAIIAQSWDACDRLTSQTVSSVASDVRRAQVVQRREYRYRADGEVLAIDDQIGGTRRFELDPAGRITAAHGNGWAERYAYDQSGNITAAAWPSQDTDAQGTRAYDGPRLRQAGNVHYRYDAQGRVVMKQRKRLSAKPDTWRYSWDIEDRMVGVVTPDGTQWRYLYDPLGRRIAKQRLDAAGSVAEQVAFCWAGEQLVEQTHSAGRAITWAHHPESGKVLTQTERARPSQQWVDEQFYSIVTDLVGTPTELIDAAGNLAWHKQSTVWGQALAALGQRAYTPLRFPGQYHDDETGLDYNHHRYYEPETGRYFSGDPLGLLPSPNPDAYVPNPLTWSDPLGLAANQSRRRKPCRCGEIRPDGRRIGIDDDCPDWRSADENASVAAGEHKNANRTQEGATDMGQHGAAFTAAARGLREEAKTPGLLPEVKEALLAKAKRYDARARAINHAV
ncbi:DUF6531 domain-containing protein [Amycolatopsis sp. NPDC059657]|uniref:DUF6531 domain-containing protein n=1 Tax=Amycolatopsis sp. NPDC059657 TaxID=3346899 RepID=UPI00366DA0B8